MDSPTPPPPEPPPPPPDPAPRPWPSLLSVGRRSLLWLACLTLLLLAAGRSVQNVLPSTTDSAARTLDDAAALDVWVDSLRSTHTWDPYLPPTFARPCYAAPHRTAAALDEALSGSRLVQLPIMLQFNRNVSFSKLCELLFSPSDLITLRRLIDSRYCLSRFVIGRHDARTSPELQRASGCYQGGMPVGAINKTHASDRYIIYNHVDFEVLFAKRGGDDSSVEVVRVAAVPLSVDLSVHADHQACLRGSSDCHPLLLDFGRRTYPFSFSLRYVQTADDSLGDADDVEAGDVWLLWLLPLAVTVGLVLFTRRVPNSVLFPSQFRANRANGQASAVFLRQLRDDITVTPGMPKLLTVAVACGQHLVVVVLSLLAFVQLGFVERPLWSTVVQTLVGLYLLTSLVLGLTYARLDRHLHVKAELLPWYAAKISHGSVVGGRSAMSETLTMHSFTLGVLGLLLLCNVVRFFSYAFSYLPLRSFVELAILWVLVSMPLAAFGKFLGAQTRPLYAYLDRRLVWGAAMLSVVLVSLGLFAYFAVALAPVFLLQLTIARNVVPCKERRITVSPWHVSSAEPHTGVADVVRTALWLLVLGAVPVAGIMLELQVLLSALMGQYAYTSLARLSFVYATFLVNCVLISWSATALSVHMKNFAGLFWRAFLTTGAAAVYTALLSTVYCLSVRELQLSLMNVVLLAATLLVGNVALGLLAGSLGFFASQTYIHRLFASYGTIVSGDIGNSTGEERYLTLNGVRFNPQLDPGP